MTDPPGAAAIAVGNLIIQTVPWSEPTTAVANLYDQPLHEAEPVPLVFRTDLEAVAIVADGHGRHVEIPGDAAH
jgi:hypothetical protein